MHRKLRGAVLAACVLGLACNTEPDGVAGGEPDRIIADPAVVLIPQFSAEEILIRVVDRQGTSIESEIAVSAPGAGIEVTADPLYRPVYGPDGTLSVNTSNTEFRLELEGVALGTTTFTLTGSGLTREITVTVVPSNANNTFAPAAPLAGDTVTLTLPAGLLWGPQAGVVSLRGDNPVFVGVNADPQSARVILPLNATLGDMVADGVQASYNLAAGDFNALPLLALPPAPTATLYPGAGACATAPVFPLPANSWEFPPAGSPRHYRFTVAGPADSIFVIRQPSPASAATGLALLDAATCTPVPPEPVVVTIPTRTAAASTNTYTQVSAITYGDPLIDALREVAFRPDSVRALSATGDTTMTITRGFLPPGDYVAQVTTGAFTLPSGVAADEPVALRFAVAKR